MVLLLRRRRVLTQTHNQRRVVFQTRLLYETNGSYAHLWAL